MSDNNLKTLDIMTALMMAAKDHGCERTHHIRPTLRGEHYQSGEKLWKILQAR